MLGGLVAALAIVVWWLFFSRAPWSERVGAIVLMIVALFATSRVLHESMRRGPWDVVSHPCCPCPGRCLGRLGGGQSTPFERSPARDVGRCHPADVRSVCAAAHGGVTGDGEFELHWRWTPTPEQRLLAQAGQKPLDLARGAPVSSVPAAPVEAPKESPVAKVSDTTATRAVDPSEPKPNAALPAVSDGRVTRVEWPGFRGAGRDGIVRGVRINTDWAKSPPVEMWRRPIGPGWSSFAVHGDLLYTQEQRGDDEIVACYACPRASRSGGTATPARFWESNWRRRSARDADAQQRSRLHVRRDRNRERARRRDGRGRVVAQRGSRRRSREVPAGASPVRPWSSTIS